MPRISHVESSARSRSPASLIRTGRSRPALPGLKRPCWYMSGNPSITRRLAFRQASWRSIYTGSMSGVMPCRGREVGGNCEQGGQPACPRARTSYTYMHTCNTSMRPAFHACINECASWCACVRVWEEGGWVACQLVRCVGTTERWCVPSFCHSCSPG